MFCPKCNKTYSASQTIINLKNLPVEEHFDPVFCPVCGWTAKTNINNIELNLYDKTTRYSNCIVEILENTITGDTSIGWQKTAETKEIE